MATFSTTTPILADAAEATPRIMPTVMLSLIFRVPAIDWILGESDERYERWENQWASTVVDW
jgi:hypothetical protein